MKNLPSISVIIPCYNAGDFLLESVESALSQEGVEVAVCVVDDGSTDGAVEDLPKDPRLRILLQKRQGACAARNRGLRETTGQWVKFLDADDVLLPDALVQQLEHARGLDVGAGEISTGRIQWMDERGHFLEHMSGDGTYGQDGLADHVSEVMRRFPMTQAPLFYRPWLLFTGVEWPLGLEREQDYAFHVSLAMRGARFVSFPYTVVGYRQHDQPERLSHQPLEVRLGEMEKQLNLLQEMAGDVWPDGMPDPVSCAFSSLCWSRGREAARGGLHSIAADWFARAERFHSPAERAGGRLYRIAVTLLGPYRVEGLFNLLARCRSIRGC